MVSSAQSRMVLVTTATICQVFSKCQTLCSNVTHVSTDHSHGQLSYGAYSRQCSVLSPFHTWCQLILTAALGDKNCTSQCGSPKPHAATNPSKCDWSKLKCAINIKCTPDFADFVWKTISIIFILITMLKLQHFWYMESENLDQFLCTFCNMSTRKFEITCVARILFTLDSPVLEYPF